MEWLLILLLLCTCKNASSLSFTATPDRVILGDSGTLTMACSVTEYDINKIYVLRIKRAVAPGSTTDEVIASFVSGTATLDSGITDGKGFSVSGVLNGALSRIEVSMDKSKMTCSDTRLYICEIGYDSSTTGKIETVTSNLTLQVFVLPQMLPPLQAKRNGNFIEGGTQSDRAKFEAGDQLELKCKANIGSIDSATIRWRKTSEMDSGLFIDYHPPEGTYDEGTPISDNKCGFTRTSTIRYNVTTPIANYDLTFECYVSVSGYPSSIITPSGVYTTTNNLQYSIEVFLSDTTQLITVGQTTQSTADVVTSCACSSNLAVLIGVAFGSVVATLTVVGIFVVVIKCLRMQNGNKKVQETGISMNQAAHDTHRVYINEEQNPVKNLNDAAPTEYEVLQESAREINTYSDLNTGQ